MPCADATVLDVSVMGEVKSSERTLVSSISVPNLKME